jgi:hypothetical protein
MNWFNIYPISSASDDMATEVSIDQLEEAVQRMHGCSARLVQSVPVKEMHANATVWEGVVHVFCLTGHSAATRAYAWSSPIEGSDKRRFFAVLHRGAIKSPQDAVRATIVAERRSKSS